MQFQQHSCSARKQINPKIHMQQQKTPNRLFNPEKKSHVGYLIVTFQIILQNQILILYPVQRSI
jgi:hypothetical protein